MVMEEKTEMRTVRAERIEFDSRQKIREDADALVVPVIFTRESILPFADGRGYRPAKELEAAAWTLEGAWIVAYKHIDTVFPTNRKDLRGRAENVKFDASINGVKGDIRFMKEVCDQQLLDSVKQGKLKDVSVAYFCEDVFSAGKFGGEPYDFVQQNFMFGHVAAGVPEGRCPSPFCGMNVDSLFVKHFDPEETEDFIHVRVRDPEGFVDDSFRTIEIDAEKGIKAVVGKLKSDPEGAMVVQKYIFAKEKDWTLDKAEAWVKEHKDSAIPQEGQPKSDRERLISHFGEEVAVKLLDLIGEEAYKLLQPRGVKLTQDSAEELSEEELKQKIEELKSKRTVIVNKLYPEQQLTPEEENKLQTDLEMLDFQLQVFMKVLAEKLAGVESSNQTEASADSLDPFEVLARSRRLFKYSR
jgi:hypothetical protein